MRHGARLLKVHGKSLVSFYIEPGGTVTDKTAAKLIEHQQAIPSMTAYCPTAISRGCGGMLSQSSLSCTTPVRAAVLTAPRPLATAICIVPTVRLAAAD